MIRVFISALILIFWSTGTAFSQKEWTLQDCIQHAQKNNLQVKQSSLSMQQSQLSMMQAKGAFLPTLNGSAAHSYNIGRTIDRFTNQFVSNQTIQSDNFSLNAGLNIFSGFQTVNNYRQSQHEVLATKYDAEKTLNDVALSIAGLYLQVLFADEQVKNTENQLQVTRLQNDRTSKLFEAGAIPKESLLNIEAQLASEELNKVNAQNAYDIALLNLALSLDLDTLENFRIAKPVVDVPAGELLNGSPAEIFTAAQQLPQIKSAETRLKGSSYALSAARGGVSPSLSFFGSFGTGYSQLQKNYSVSSYNGLKESGYVLSDGTPVYQPDFTILGTVKPFGTQLSENLNQVVGLSLSVPIFNGFQNHANISRARISVESSRISLQGARIQLRKDVQQAFADASAAYKKYLASQKSFQALQETFKYTQQRFDVGLLNAVDYNTTKQRLVQAESNLLQAKYDLVFRTKILDFYRGKPIAL